MTFGVARLNKSTAERSTTYIVGCPERFEFEVPLQAVAQAALELCGQLGHTFVLRIIHQRTHRFQVLNKSHNTNNKTISINKT